ncbi:Hypothetical protein A7982_06356 [Minicystis rosea]|nr:Hypothetical protein A7982_06356 [Minicystis rosea]
MSLAHRHPGYVGPSGAESSAKPPDAIEPSRLRRRDRPEMSRRRLHRACRAKPSSS